MSLIRDAVDSSSMSPLHGGPDPPDFYDLLVKVSSAPPDEEDTGDFGEKLISFARSITSYKVPPFIFSISIKA